MIDSASAANITVGDSRPWVLRGDARMSLEELCDLSVPGHQIEVDGDTLARIERCRAKLTEYVERGRVMYGVNTGVGGFVDRLVPVDHAAQLQNNIINAVATNVGGYLDERATRAIMLARIKSLARANSAISVENFGKLVEMFNAGVAPCVPEKGSLGTSGDLAQLASIALVGSGQWRARLDGCELPGAEALHRAGIEPMALSFKEGLALINGTSGMVGLGALVLAEAKALLDTYIAVSALSCEGLAGKTKPFDPRVHALKPHRGQQRVAEMMWGRLSDSKLALDEDSVEHILAARMRGDAAAGHGQMQIEDAYSIRCTPQILGPVLDSMAAIERVLEDELNSSNDNPLLVPDQDDLFHNGHFHGQYIAMAMDHLAIALVTLCNLADRRIDRFMTGANSNGLPPFLCENDAGLRLGLMGGQFMATSLTAENRSLCTPISIQTLPSTGDVQDVVSFGFVAARRARTVLANTRYVVAFELLCACQAADIRGPHGLSASGRMLYEATRQIVPYLDHDIVLTDYLEALARGLLDGRIARAIHTHGVAQQPALSLL
ncbi:MAG TPA: phenylalanine aminomutase (D-beta-phenylalanine forming) [Kofleriaceae bacterium]